MISMTVGEVVKLLTETLQAAGFSIEPGDWNQIFLKDGDGKGSGNIIVVPGKEWRMLNMSTYRTIQQICVQAVKGITCEGKITRVEDVKAAEEGSFYSKGSSYDMAEMVKAGKVSVSTAMNQDM